MRTRHIKIKKGLDIPIEGEPDQFIEAGRQPSTVAVLGSDYRGLKPDFTVSVGDDVKLGQVMFTDKKMPSIKYTSPGSGKVIAINRGEKRKLLSVVIELKGDDEVEFQSYAEHELTALARDSVVALLLESGMWTSIRARPFSKVADPESVPRSLFVTAMDTNPLAPSVPAVLRGKEREFTNGLKVLSRLTEGRLYLCKSHGDSVPEAALDSLSTVEFSGPHPAGNTGTHIHCLDPVGRSRTVWYVGAQDVAAVGALFTTGRLDVQRTVSFAGPSVKNPRLIKTRIGAWLDDLVKRELKEGEHRIISGSVLSGHSADQETAFLGRYHQQVSVIPEGGTREFLGWLKPGTDLYSIKNIVLSRLFRSKQFHFSSSMHGDRRAIVPVGSYEKVMPLDIMPTHLLRSLEVDDIDEAEKLGCLELDEEDLALCTFVCPSKIDHGVTLRRNLTLLEKEW